MLTPDEWIVWVAQVGLSERAQRLISEVRTSEPARHVQGRSGNVCARYPSWKMGHIVQAESHTVELGAIRCSYEFDDTVLEYWDQPCKLKLSYSAKHGKTVGFFHTPDFLVMRKNSAIFEEWKMAEGLPTLVEQMPNRYVREADNIWRCPPGEASAGEFGLGYRVRTTAEFSPIFHRNIAFLEDYLRPDTPDLTQEIRQGIAKAVQSYLGISLAHLLQTFSADAIYTSIVRHDIHVDLGGYALADPEHVRVFRDADIAQAFAVTQTARAMATSKVNLVLGATLEWDQQPWRIINLGEIMVALASDNAASQIVELPRTQFEALIAAGRINMSASPICINDDHARAAELILKASPEDLQAANERYQAVLATLAGTTPLHAWSARTQRHYVKRYREAEAAFGAGYLGLITCRAQKGNRRAKLPDRSETLLQQYIDSSFETLKQKSIRQAYGEYVLACEREGIGPASRITFGKRIRSRPREAQVRKRRGDRAAYEHTLKPVWRLALSTPHHGDFPWQMVHLDHSELDIELVCAKTGRNLGRPWLTLMIDAFSRRILAACVSFDAPSYRACMMVMVECVRRHGRLPQTIIVDNGAEFGSAYFEALLARYSIIKLTRPAAQPRFGSIIERLFRTNDSVFIHNLRGNTQVTRLVRQVTQHVNPKGQAVWTLGELHSYLCTWVYEVYDQLDHPALGQTPCAAFLAGLATGGLRPQRRIELDETFRILTLPTTARGTAKVIPGRGVKVNYLFYWCDAFRQPSVEETHVPIRFDPFNAGLAYAYVNGQWTQCICGHYAVFRDHSERELMLATQILRQRQSQHQQHADIRAKLLADFILSAEAEELLLEQRLRDNEARQLRETALGLSPDHGTTILSTSISPTAKMPPLQLRPAELEQYGEIIQ